MAANSDPAMTLDVAAAVELELTPDRPTPLSDSIPTVSKKHAAIVAAAMTAAIVASLGYLWWSHARAHVTTDNAFVAGDVHQVSARVAGTISEVLIHDNQAVAAGTPLLKLDPRDLDLRVQQARSQLSQAGAHRAQTEAQWQHANAQLAQGEAKSAKARAELEKATQDYARADHLAEGGRFAVISRQEFDATKAALDVAKASTEVAAADLQSSNALVKSAKAAVAAALALEHGARVSLADAELQQSYTIISAPAAGIIGRRNAETGQRVQPGQALLAIVANEKWIVANFKETQLARLHPGQPVSVSIDALPGRKFTGRVESFSPASGAQFALLPPDNATGNFTKVVQRVSVKIEFDAAAIAGFEERINPGLSAVVDVHVGRSE